MLQSEKVLVDFSGTTERGILSLLLENWLEHNMVRQTIAVLSKLVFLGLILTCSHIVFVMETVCRNLILVRVESD